MRDWVEAVRLNHQRRWKFLSKHKLKIRSQ
jgi:hypothetical protein